MKGSHALYVLVVLLCVETALLLAGRPVASSTSMASPGAEAATQPWKVYDGWPFDGNEAARRRGETARGLAMKADLEVSLEGNVAIQFALIPSGRFKMGSPRKEEGHMDNDEEFQHYVTTSRPFYMGVYHVTRGQFAAFVRVSKYQTDAETAGKAVAWDGTMLRHVNGASWRTPGFRQTDDHPVVCVSHGDAVAFCEWLSKKVGRTVALPTEAEWEYACRAGTETAYQWGQDPKDGEGWCNNRDQTLKKVVSHMGTYYPWVDGHAFTAPVGRFKANAFGLHDMHGNVRQWCQDWFGGDYYRRSPATDPAGPTTGDLRVTRGSAWCDGPNSRSASRGGQLPERSSCIVGFRVILRPSRPDR